MSTPVKTFLRLAVPGDTGPLTPMQQDKIPVGGDQPLQVLRYQKLSRQHRDALAVESTGGTDGAPKRPRQEDDWLFEQNEVTTTVEEQDAAGTPLRPVKCEGGQIVVTFDCFTSPTKAGPVAESRRTPNRPPPPLHSHTAAGVPNAEPSYRDRPLDKHQMLCVTHDTNGPLLIRAGAGSGKTQTISKRIAYMLTCGVPAYNILGLSFSRASAEELRHRVATTLPTHKTSEASKLKMKTIHGFCLEMIRKYREGGGSLVLFDDRKRRGVAERAVMSTMGPHQSAPSRRVDRDVVDELLRLIDLTKRTVPSHGGRAWSLQKFNSSVQVAQFKKYEEILHEEEGACDFADLQWFLYLLLLDDTPRDELHGRSVVADIRRRFTHIVVDEVQDVDEVQYEILCRIAGDECRVSCVGDPRQAIYGFRGAVTDFFKRWKGRFGIQDDGQRELLLNYRSVSQVVDVSNLVASAYVGNCSSVKGPGSRPVVVHYAVDREDMGLKALKLIRSICADTQRGLGFKDIGIVARKTATGRALQKLLQQNRIPCRTLRRRDPTAAVMMRALLAHLRCLIDPYVSNTDVIEALEYPEKLARSTRTGLISGRKSREDRLLKEAQDMLPFEGPHVLNTVACSSNATPRPRVSYFELIEELVQNQFMVPDAQLVPRTKKDKDALARWYDAVIQLHHELRRVSIPSDVLKFSQTARTCSTKYEEGVKQEPEQPHATVRTSSTSLHPDERSAALKEIITKALNMFGFVAPANCDAPGPFADAADGGCGIVTVTDDDEEVDALVDSGDSLEEILFEALDNLHATGDPCEGVAGLCALVDSLQPLDGNLSDYGARRPQRHPQESVSDALRREHSLQENRVTISTVHKAKGLEWPVVFVFDCTEGEMPIVNHSGSYKEEERRIFYVAVSRAMEELVLFAQESERRMPSRFLKCLDGHVVEVREQSCVQ